MKAVRLYAPGVDGLRYETMDTPPLRAGEALVEVHAAAITRDELECRSIVSPAVPSYELSGVVASVDDLAEVSVGDEVYALTPFDRDGVAAEYAAVAAQLLAPKPASQHRLGASARIRAGVSASGRGARRLGALRVLRGRALQRRPHPIFLFASSGTRNRDTCRGFAEAPVPQALRGGRARSYTTSMRCAIAR
jgi:hypothetical protein